MKAAEGLIPPCVRSTAYSRRVRGMHIGSALRHARAAASLNLDGAHVEEIRREAELALNSLGAIVWTKGGEGNG